MSTGKGKEIATKPDWKEQLAILDQKLGWDVAAGSEWADSCETENHEVFTPDQPLQNEHENENNANILQFTEHSHGDYSHANQDSNHTRCQALDSIEDDEVVSADMQKILWEAAVEEARSVACVDPRIDTGDDNDEIYTKPNQHQQEEDSYEEEEQEEELIQPESKLEAYIYHRFGLDIIYENRYSFHEHLYDPREEQNKRTREYFTQAGGSNLIKDPCMLLPYPQDDISGTEHVNKPLLMVTTPKGETLYPHDMEEYPEPPPASWHGPKIGWGGASPQGGHVVPYEDEDSADI